MSWTPELISEVKRLWQAGWSAGDIERVWKRSRTANFSRSSILGKLYRMGLKKGREDRRPAMPRKKKRKKHTGHARGLARKPGEAASTQDALRPSPAVGELLKPTASLLELEAHMCKWPIGDPKDEDFGFCGRDKAPGKPYCEHHCAWAYNTAPPRRGKGVHWRRP